MSSRHHQRGVALLVAILLVALGTIIAAGMAYNNAMTARRAVATFSFDQALLVAEGGEAIAAYGLAQQLKMNAPYIGPGQVWSQPLPPTEVAPGVTLEASMEDLQGRFNINNLVNNDDETPNPTAIAVFQRLLQRLGMDPKWAYYTVDWIDQNSTPMSPDGAEDSVYLEAAPPYRTANMPITSTSELMALPGFTRADFDRLAPHIVALPIGTKVNVCSADPWVLDALTGVEQFTAQGLDQFEKDRQAASGCFPPLASVKVSTANVTGGTVSLGGSTGTANGTQQTTPQDLIGQTSVWFRLSSFVTVGSSEFAVYTVLYHDTTGVRPMMRSFTPD
jgi:general secretion pathway protein K